MLSFVQLTEPRTPKELMARNLARKTFTQSPLPSLANMILPQGLRTRSTTIS